MSLRLEGKSIVVVGGTTGLGLSAAKAFVGEGARVVVVGRSPESAQAAESELGEAGVAYVGDASDSSTAVAAIELATERFGGFHGLYHVAGGSGRKFGDGPLHEITDDGWQATLDLNLTSLFNSNRAAVRYFLEEGMHGTILNMGSVLGWSPSPAFFSTHAYATTKAALEGLTKVMAAELGPKQIRTGCILPGAVSTELNLRAGLFTAEEAKDRYNAVAGLHALGRIGTGTEIAEGVEYLICAEWVTGVALEVDGGIGLGASNF